MHIHKYKEKWQKKLAKMMKIWQYTLERSHTVPQYMYMKI